MIKKMLAFGIIVYCSIFILATADALQLHAFGDVTFENTTKSGEAPGFKLGQLDLWATQKIDRQGKLKTFLELVIESPGEGFLIDLERLWVSYTFMPELELRAGRFHSSLGYWNQMHHHGGHMQTTVFRPLFLDFEDGSTAILPTHIVGAMGIVDIGTGLGGLRFELQYGNGSSYNGSEIDPGSSGDLDTDKGIITRVVFSPAAIEGLGAGFSFYTNSITNTAMMSDLVDQKIYVADLTYFENNIEFIFEYYWVSNKDKRSGFSETSRTSPAWYVQGGYTFSDILTPYARYEYLDDIDSADPYFTTLGTTQYTQTVLGARYDIVQNSSVKIEGRFKDEPAAQGGSSESYHLQWTFGF